MVTGNRRRYCAGWLQICDARDGGRLLAATLHALALLERPASCQRGVEAACSVVISTVMISSFFSGRSSMIVGSVLRRRRMKGGEQAEALGHLLVVLALDGLGEVVAEEAGGPEDARVAEVEDGAHLREAVLHRGAGQRDAVAPGQGAHGPRRPGGGVLDGLRLVEDDAVPGDLPQLVEVAADDAVAGDHEIRLRHARRQLLAMQAVGAVLDDDAQPRNEAGGLLRPVAHHRGRRDDECGAGGLPAVVLDGQQREELQGLARPVSSARTAPRLLRDIQYSQSTPRRW